MRLYRENGEHILESDEVDIKIASDRKILVKIIKKGDTHYRYVGEKFPKYDRTYSSVYKRKFLISYRKGILERLRREEQQQEGGGGYG